jgi:hypothetical protein
LLAALLLLSTALLASCGFTTTYDAPSGQLSVTVSGDTDPPDQIWQINSRGPKAEWTVGCLSDDGSAGTFRNVEWTEARTFNILTSEDTISVTVDSEGKPALSERELGLRPCP